MTESLASSVHRRNSMFGDNGNVSAPIEYIPMKKAVVLEPIKNADDPEELGRRRKRIDFHFTTDEVTSIEYRTHIDFKLSHYLVLEGISIAQPKIHGTNISVSIKVFRGGCISLHSTFELLAADYGKLKFQQPMFIETGERIKIAIETLDTHK